MTFAARDFSPRRGMSDEHIPPWICEERATKSGRKRRAALRVAPNLACGFVTRRLQPHGKGMRPRRASPQAKLGATNVIVFMPQTTKARAGRAIQWSLFHFQPRWISTEAHEANEGRHLGRSGWQGRRQTESWLDRIIKKRARCVSGPDGCGLAAADRHQCQSNSSALSRP